MNKVAVMQALSILIPPFVAGVPVSSVPATGAYPDYAPADWRTNGAGIAALVGQRNIGTGLQQTMASG